MKKKCLPKMNGSLKDVSKSEGHCMWIKTYFSSEEQAEVEHETNCFCSTLIEWLHMLVKFAFV